MGKYIDASISNRVADVFKRYTISTVLIKSSGRPECVRVQTIPDYSFRNGVIYFLGTDEQTAQIVKDALRELHSVAVKITTTSWAGSDPCDVHVTDRYGTKEYAQFTCSKYI